MAYSCTPSALAKKLFGAETAKTRKHYRDSGFMGNCLKPKNDTVFFEKVFQGWVKKWFLLTVFC